MEKAHPLDHVLASHQRVEAALKRASDELAVSKGLLERAKATTSHLKGLAEARNNRPSNDSQNKPAKAA